MTLFVFVLGAMTLLSPGRDHTELASVVSRVVSEEPRLYQKDEDGFRTAALMVAISYRESNFTNGAKSKTDDHCAFQIHGRPELREDLASCVRVAHRMLRESIRVCREYPVAHYAEGGSTCGSDRAKRISTDRTNLAAYVLRRLDPHPEASG